MSKVKHFPFLDQIQHLGWGGMASPFGIKMVKIVKTPSEPTTPHPSHPQLFYQCRISLTLHGAIPKCIVGPSVPSAPSLAFRSCTNVNFSGCDGSVSQSDRVMWGEFHWRRVPPPPSVRHASRRPSTDGHSGRVTWDKPNHRLSFMKYSSFKVQTTKLWRGG